MGVLGTQITILSINMIPYTSWVLLCSISLLWVWFILVSQEDQ